MKLEARITQLEFVPNDRFKIQGFAHAGYDYSKICGSKPEFELGWFWRSDMPAEIKKVLLEVESDITVYLQDRNIIPKVWPGNLVNTTNDGVFTYRILKFVIQNSAWNVKGTRSYVDIRVHSELHNNGDPIVTSIHVDITKEYSKMLFDTLDKHL